MMSAAQVLIYLYSLDLFHGVDSGEQFAFAARTKPILDPAQSLAWAFVMGDIARRDGCNQVGGPVAVEVSRARAARSLATKMSVAFMP